jgi:16S rRNA G966 N2-methylase RsmD
MKNFIIVRIGNKQRDLKYFNMYLPKKNEIESVAEPFAGSFSVIRNYYYDVNNIYCADNDEIYKEKIKLIFNDLEGFKTERENIIKFYKDNNTNLEEMKKRKVFIKRDILKEFSKTLKFHTFDDLFARGIIKTPSMSFDYSDLKKLYDKIKWFDDYKIIFEKLKNDNKSFCFVDPPYFQSANKSYCGDDYRDKDNNLKDNTSIYIDILHFMNEAKCKVMLIINSSEIIKYLFKDYYKGCYNKLYTLSQSKQILNIYTNY